MQPRASPSGVARGRVIGLGDLRTSAGGIAGGLHLEHSGEGD